MKPVRLFFVLFTLTSCELTTSSPGYFRNYLFEKFGYVFLMKPDEKSTKEIHLEGVNLINRLTLVSGTIAELGDHGTYVVLADEQGRIVVDLSTFYRQPHVPPLEKGQQARILGRVQTGKQGLFYLSALTVSPSQKNAKP